MDSLFLLVQELLAGLEEGGESQISNNQSYK
jgi:hypothetical protein